MVFFLFRSLAAIGGGLKEGRARESEKEKGCFLFFRLNFFVFLFPFTFSLPTFRNCFSISPSLFSFFSAVALFSISRARAYAAAPRHEREQKRKRGLERERELVNKKKENQKRKKRKKLPPLRFPFSLRLFSASLSFCFCFSYSTPNNLQIPPYLVDAADDGRRRPRRQGAGRTSLRTKAADATFAFSPTRMFPSTVARGLSSRRRHLRREEAFFF